MKDGAVFVSLGRGQAVDEEALFADLKKGRLYAACDVFATEPLPKDSPLWGCENLIISAHAAGGTADFSELGWEVFVDNLEAFRQKKRFRTPVDTAAGY